MEFFITSETTVDVSFDEQSVLLAFEEHLNRTVSDLVIDAIDGIAVIPVIMNPKIAPPFPAGVILRRRPKALEIRPVIEFSSWKATDRRGRIALLVEAASDVLRTHRKRGVSDVTILAAEAALKFGHQTFEVS